MTARERGADPPLLEAPLTPQRLRFPPGSRARVAYGIGLALLHAFAFFVAAPAIASAAGSTESLFVASPRTFALLVVVGAVDAAAIVGLGLVRFGQASLPSLGWRGGELGRSLVLALGGLATCLVVTALLWLSAGPGRDLAGFAQALGGATLAERGFFMLIGLHAAFVEESIFRGYLQPALVARWGVAAGIVATAAIFALYHLNPRPIALVGKLAFGIVFGVLRHRDGTLASAALAHALLWSVVGAM